MLCLIFSVYVANKRMYIGNHRLVFKNLIITTEVMERLALRQLFCCCRSVPCHEFDAEGACEVNGGKEQLPASFMGNHLISLIGYAI